ncbi:acyltransferase [Pontibacter sp. CAU 1760]
MTYFVHETAIVDEGCHIGQGTRIWHFSHVMSGSRLGEACNIGQNVVISPQVVLGRNVKVQNNVSLYTGVTCEDDVFIGPSVVFTNVLNPRSFVNRKEAFRPTVIREGATIGANATVVCGIEIGAFAMVGAGAVLTKSIPAFALWYGNPARHQGWVSRYGHRLHFDAEHKATCPETGEVYTLQGGTHCMLALPPQHFESNLA